MKYVLQYRNGDLAGIHWESEYDKDGNLQSKYEAASYRAKSQNQIWIGSLAEAEHVLSRRLYEFHIKLHIVELHTCNECGEIASFREKGDDEGDPESYWCGKHQHFKPSSKPIFEE